MNPSVTSPAGVDRFRGVFTALVTPMTLDGALDEEAFRRFVDWQISQGIHGLVPTGTTGESATLSHRENLRVIELCLEVAGGRVPVLAGVGANALKEAIYLSKQAEQLGVDGLLSVVPYYNNPSQEGIYQHFRAIVSATSLPLMVYNVPGRTVSNISVATLGRLVETCPRVFGIKDADSKNLGRVADTRHQLGDAFVQLSGDDATFAGHLALGGHGAISVVSNVVPRLVVACYEAWKAADLETFLRLNLLVTRWQRACFADNSPAPTKYALSVGGGTRGDRMTSHTRLPIAPASEAAKSLIDTMRADAASWL